MFGVLKNKKVKKAKVFFQTEHKYKNGNNIIEKLFGNENS